jgi:hypothetical protein
VTEVAVLLYAETATLTPLEGLVVPEATSIETNVAADRAHVSQNGRGYRRGGLGEYGVLRAKEGGCLDFTQRGQRADLGSLASLHVDASQL